MRWRALALVVLSAGLGALDACDDDTAVTPVPVDGGGDATSDAGHDQSAPASEAGPDALAEAAPADGGVDGARDATPGSDASNDAGTDGAGVDAGDAGVDASDAGVDAGDAGADSSGADAGDADAGSVTTFNVLHNGLVYTINGAPAPALTLTRGVTYTFNFGNFSTHPFIFTTDSAGGTIGGELSPAQLPGYVQGASCVSGCVASIQTITPDANTPSSFYYQCAVHMNMGAAITVTP